MCRPSDVHAEQLASAAARKNTSYNALTAALAYYRVEGWEIRIFPLVVGIRGLMDVKPFQAAFEFLEIPGNLWQTGVESAALASVQAFSFLHRIRYGARLASNHVRWRHTQSAEHEEEGSEELEDKASEDSVDDCCDTNDGNALEELSEGSPLPTANSQQEPSEQETNTVW